MTTPLPGSAQLATPGVAGFDTVDRLNQSEAAKFAASGYRFAFVYLDDELHVSEHGEVGGGTTRQAIEWLLEAGIPVMPVQFAPGRYNASRGRATGAAARENALELGFAPGVQIYVDVESVGGSTDEQIIDHVNEWHREVERGGYKTGLYNGTRRLDGVQLFHDLAVTSYWRAAISGVATPDVRGYSLYQTRRLVVHGVTIDHDILVRDNGRDGDGDGDPPTWHAPPC